MTVAVLCLSKGHGGLELYALREMKALRERDVPCIAIVARQTMLSDRLTSEKLPCEYLSVWNKHLPIIAALRLKNIIRKYDIQVMHFHWTPDLNLAVLAKVFSGNRIRLVYSRHMQITRSKHDILHRWFYSKLERVLAITKGVQEEAQRYFPVEKEKIKLLYLGVAEPEHDQYDCAQFFAANDIQSQRLNIAVFGRIEHEKGQHVIIDAALILKQKSINVSVTLIGHVMDQAYARQLEQKVQQNGLAGDVRFIGFIPAPVQYMPCFDVIVLTTYRETFGLVLVEAMRAGVAVIGTDAGGVREIIDHEETGLRFQPGDANDLAGCIERLYRDGNLLTRLASRGKVIADQRFSEKSHFDQLKLELSN